MPLKPSERQFLQMIDRLKIYVLALGLAVFVFVLSIPQTQLSVATSLVVLTLCGLLWVTQRLLTLITVLDLELTKSVAALKSSLTDEQREELSRH